VNDTSKKIGEIYIEMMMKKSPIERLKMGFSMFDSARKLALSAKNEDEDERKFLFLRFYGDDFDDATKKKIIEKIEK